jgi:hypothetical protein
VRHFANLGDILDVVDPGNLGDSAAAPSGPS